MALLLWIGLLLLLPGCKSPRPPHEAPIGNVSGEWSARSVATTRPQPTGEVAWRLILEQQDAGKIRGRGTLTDPGASASFSVHGLRGENILNLHLDFEDGRRMKFDGSLMGATSLVGSMDLSEDTIPVTFTRP